MNIVWLAAAELLVLRHVTAAGSHYDIILVDLNMLIKRLKHNAKF